MKIYYSLGFALDPKTGRGEGSLRKIQALSGAEVEVIVFSYFESLKGFYFFYKVLNIIYQVLADTYYLLTEGGSIDVVVVRENVLFPFWLARARGIPVCAEVHAAGWEEVGSSRLKKLVAEIYRVVSIYSLRRSDMLIYNHPDLKQYFFRHHGVSNPSLVSYNGGNFPSFNSHRPATKAQNGEILYVYAGNIYPWHGVDLLAPILRVLASKINYRFYLVGGTESEYADKVRHDLKRIHQCTIVNDSRKDVLMEYICAADYCFLPSADQRVSPGSPIKLFDYMKFGKRVITQRDFCGYSDVVTSAGAGFAIDFFDPHAAVSEILSRGPCRTNSTIENEIIRNAKHEHSWESRIKMWLDFFEKQGVNK